MQQKYESPFSTRYASDEMQYLFSADMKFKTWRRLWIALAKGEQKLGLPISDSQIAELEAHAEDINYDVARQREKECRHDVMSHVYAYGVQCPEAKGIIHLGATSCYAVSYTHLSAGRRTHPAAAGRGRAARRYAGNAAEARDGAGGMEVAAPGAGAADGRIGRGGRTRRAAERGEGYGPVSYTHLDVYKRQRQWRPWQAVPPSRQCPRRGWGQ